MIPYFINKKKIIPMNIKKTQTQNSINASLSFNSSEFESRLERLEKISHKPCDGGKNLKFDLSNLPQLPDKKITPIEKRVAALEELVEQLIKKLSN